jgi:hypothetical protein
MIIRCNFVAGSDGSRQHGMLEIDDRWHRTDRLV